MKSIYTTFALLILIFNVSGQVSINQDGSPPHPSAMLEVNSTSAGFLLPRLNLGQRDSIVSPAAGLMIYNTDCQDIQYFNGWSWIPGRQSPLLEAPDSLFYLSPYFCIFQPFSIDIDPVAGALAYEWVVSGGEILSGQGTTSVEIISYGSLFTVCVSTIGNCGKSEQLCEAFNAYVPEIPGVVLSSGSNPSCIGSMVMFTTEWFSSQAFPLSYQWYVNNTVVAGAVNPNYEYIPSDSDQVYCEVLFQDECNNFIYVNSNTIDVTVNPLTSVSITISASATSVCNATPVNFTSAMVGGGSLPSFQWKKNNINISGATTSGYSYTPANNDVISCVGTSNLACTSGNPATSNNITMTVETSLTKSHVAGTVAPVAKTVTYGLVSNIAGASSLCWITRNLGASSQATAASTNTESAAGWYWQFNRKQGFKHDGTTLTPAWTVTSITQTSDWTATNDPCTIELGGSWRIPTKSEYDAIDNAGSWTTWSGPYGSALKLHAAGYLGNSNGAITSRGATGQYWSTTQSSSTNGWAYVFTSSTAASSGSNKARGATLRCVK
jgi:hypothetical protein